MPYGKLHNSIFMKYNHIRKILTIFRFFRTHGIISTSHHRSELWFLLKKCYFCTFPIKLRNTCRALKSYSVSFWNHKMVCIEGKFQPQFSLSIFAVGVVMQVRFVCLQRMRKSIEKSNSNYYQKYCRKLQLSYLQFLLFNDSCSSHVFTLE